MDDFGKISSIESLPLPEVQHVKDFDAAQRTSKRAARAGKKTAATGALTTSSVTVSQGLPDPNVTRPATEGPAGTDPCLDESEVDYACLDDAHLHEANLANLQQFAQMRDQTEKFAYRRVLPAINETIARYKQPGRSTRLNGMPKIEDYLQSINLNYATVRKWNERERKATLALLPAPPKRESKKRLISKGDEPRICITVTTFQNLKDAVSAGDFERATNIANGSAEFALRNYVGHLAGRTAYSSDSPVPPTPAPPSIALANETKLSIANRIVDTILASNRFDDEDDLRTLALAYRTAAWDNPIPNVPGRYEHPPVMEPSLARTSFSSRVGNGLNTLPASTLVLSMRKRDNSFERIPLRSPPTICFLSKIKLFDFYLQGIAYLQRYERLENVESAIILFQRAIKEDHNYAQAQAALARAYWYKYSATKDPQWANQAKAAVNAAENLDSRLPEVQLAIANLNLQTGAFPAALSAFQRVVGIDPENSDAYLGLGNTYDSLGRTADAERAFRHAIEIRPGCWSCYNKLGIFLNNHSRYSEAADAWRKVTELAPDNVWGYMNVGDSYFNTGTFEMADQYFRRGLQVAPDDPDLYSNIGTVSFFLGRFNEDVEYTQKAIALRPQKYEYWGNLADAYRMIPSQTDKARNAYRQAISLAEKLLAVNPSDIEALSSLAQYHSRIGDAMAARKYLDRALQVNPNDVDNLRIACLVYLDAGQQQEAFKWLEKSVRAGYSREQLIANPELASLRSEPEFGRLVGEAVSIK